MEIGSLSDANRVLLQASNGKLINTTRRLLAAESGYFRSLFTHHFRDTKKSIHRLPFDYHELEAILSVAGCDDEEIPLWCLSDATKLLSSANYLQFDRLLPYLHESIISQIDVVNLISVLRYAVNRDIVLAGKLWQLVVKYFNRLIDDSGYTTEGEFLKLTEDEMITAMNNQKLNIESRNEAIVIQKYLSVHSDSPKLRQMADNLIRTGDGHENPVVMNRIPAEVLFAVGGWSNDAVTGLAEVYNPRRNSWNQTDLLDLEPVAYHGLTIQNNHIFFCGGMNGAGYHKTVKAFDLNTQTWHQHEDMKEQRVYPNMISIPFSNGSSQLMVIGGFNGQDRLSSCEFIGPMALSSTSMKAMDKARSDAGMTLFSIGLAVVGGFDGTNVHQDGEMYDVETNIWIPLKKMHHARTGVCATAIDRSVLFVAGGYNGHSRLSTAEFYDVREEKWHQLPSMHTCRSNFGLECLNGEIYAVGGYDGIGTTGAVEKFDLIARRWIKLPDLTFPRSALKMIRLSDHDIIRQMINFDAD